MASPTIMGGIPPQSPNFVGRENILQRLADLLTEHGQATVLLTALRGLGGIGKSQVAAEYARPYQHLYDLVWWIPTEDAHVQADGCAPRHRTTRSRRDNGYLHRALALRADPAWRGPSARRGLVDEPRTVEWHPPSRLS
jgi:hypothetical protein